MDLILIIRSLAFYVIPIIIGRALYVTLQKKERVHVFAYIKRFLQRAAPIPDESSHVSVVLDAVRYFITGSTMIFLFAMCLRHIAQLQHQLFVLVFFSGILGATIASVFLNLLHIPHLRFFKETIFVLLLTGFLSAGAYGIWTWKSPTPLNWDYYQHQLLSTQILSGNMHFFTSRMSDTFGFNSYPPFFHLLLAISQFGMTLESTEIVDFWQTISFVHLFIATLAGYCLGYAVTQKKEIGVLNAICSALLFDSVVSFTNLFFLPQTVAATVVIFLLCRIWSQKNVRVHEVVVGIVFLSFMHYVVGIFGAVLYFALYCYQTIPFLKNNLFKLLLPECIVLGAIIGMLLSHQLNLTALNQGEASLYVFSIAEKLDFAQRIYGFLPLFLFPIGVLFILKNATQKTYLTLAITLGFGTIIFSNFPYVLKFYTIGRYFFHLILALGFWQIAQHITFRPLRWCLYGVISIGLSCVLILNTLFWKNGLLYGDHYTHISQYDLAAAKFLQDVYGNKNVVMISDPATQFILEGLSDVNSVAGVYAPSSNRQLFASSLESANPELLYTQLSQLQDRITPPPSSRLLVLSGRTFLWLQAGEKEKMSFDFNIWTPQALSVKDQMTIEHIAKSPRFQRVYTSPSLVIFSF